MIDEVPYDKVIEIRRKGMYPDKDESFVKLPNDEFGIHIGYHVNDIPVSVLSIFLEERNLQFRKFATLPQHQGKGYGNKLIDWLLSYAEDMKFDKVWCNARIDKVDFYKKYGFIETDDFFDKNGHQYVILERRK